MDPVSNANRIAMLLRQRLQERSNAATGQDGVRSGGGAPARARGKGAVHNPDAIEALDDRKLKRALIEDILADQFGQALLNDAKFQQVIDRVTEALDADSACGALLARAVSDLRAGRV